METLFIYIISRNSFTYVSSELRGLSYDFDGENIEYRIVKKKRYYISFLKKLKYAEYIPC